MSKVIGFVLLLSLQSFAMDFYPLKFGVGTESCHPNHDGLTECHGSRPESKPVNIKLVEAADGAAFYGYHTQTGTFEKIGFEAKVTVTHFEGKGIDDMLNISLKTWSLDNPEIKTEASSEVFTAKPENLNRMNILAKPIGTEDDFSTVILGLERN